MKNGSLGLFPKALNPLALALLGFMGAVLHAAPPPVDAAGFTAIFNGQNSRKGSIPKGA